jgi:hypothetical protein
MDTESRVQRAMVHLNQLQRTVDELGILNSTTQDSTEHLNKVSDAIEKGLANVSLRDTHNEFILYHFITSDNKKWRLELEWIGWEVDGRPGAADMKVARWRYSIVHDATNAAVITHTIVVPENESPPDSAAVASQVAEKMGDLLQSMISKSTRIT